MPESHDIYRMFLGEYPWALSVPVWDDDGWTKGFYSEIPVQILSCSDRYVWEGSGYDCSTNDTIGIQLPCKWLIDQMGLKWNSGREGQYFDNHDQLVMFDPSLKEPGPSVLLVNKELLEDFLKESRYDLVWTVLGEKQILGPSLNRGEWKGFLEMSGAIIYKDGQYDITINSKYKAPDR